MDLTKVPELVLDRIVTYLPFEDLLTFSQTGPAFAHLQPEYEEILQPDFEIHQLLYDYGCLVPKHFFDAPVKTCGILSVRMSFKWKDQGVGNRKGHIWLQLVRCGEVIADNRAEYGGLAPHDWEDRDVEVKDHDVVKKCVCGDVLRVMMNIGGGGGHSLNVKNFWMRIVFKKPNDGYDEEYNDDGDDGEIVNGEDSEDVAGGEDVTERKIGTGSSSVEIIQDNKEGCIHERKNRGAKFCCW